MKNLMNSIALLAILSLSSPAMAAPVKSAALAKQASAISAPSPYIDYKNVNAIKKILESYSFEITDTEDPTHFIFSSAGVRLHMMVDACDDPNTCGMGFIWGEVPLEKKPTDAWLVRMKQFGVAVASYQSDDKQLIVWNTMTLKGINEEALHFNITNTIAETDIVIESISKKEHLKK